MPPVETILVEVPQPEGPYGAKGMGEAVLVPTAAAVAGALYAFDGIRRTSLPMRDSPAARALLPRLAREAVEGGGDGGRRIARQEGSPDVRGHPGPRLRPPPPLLGAGPGHARPAQVATSFQEILEQVWWRLDTALDLEMIRWSAMLGALEALENGTTAIIDHHESPNAIEGSLDVIAEACAEVGVRSRAGLRDHRPPRARRRPAGPRRERALHPGRRPGPGRDPRRLHLLRRVPARGGRAGRGPRGRRPRPRLRGRRRHRRAGAGSRASPATTGCWPTASTCRPTTRCAGPSSTTRCRT